MAEGLGHNTNWCIMTNARLGRWVVSQYGRDTAGEKATIRRRGRTTQCPARRYNARHDREGLQHSARDTTHDTAGHELRHAHDTVEGRPRYGQGEAATRCHCAP